MCVSRESKVIITEKKKKKHNLVRQLKFLSYLTEAKEKPFNLNFLTIQNIQNKRLRNRTWIQNNCRPYEKTHYYKKEFTHKIAQELIIFE